MNCHRINRRGKPAGRLHSLVCTECREAQRTDDLLAFGIVQLKKATQPHTALNRMLTSLDLSPLAEDYARRRRRRRTEFVVRTTGATLAIGVFGWFSYMDWIPAEAHFTPLRPETPAYAALQNVVKARDNKHNHISEAIGVLEAHKIYGPVLETDTVRQFVTENARSLEIIRANLSVPYMERGRRTIQDIGQDPRPLQAVVDLLRADAVSKASQGDRAGTLAAALQMIAFGENIAGGGSLNTRLAGLQCQSFGRQLIWSQLPGLSAAEARHASRKIDQARQTHPPLLETLRWERDSGLAIRQNLLRMRVWRWQFTGEIVHKNSQTPQVVQHLLATACLYTLSNRRVLANYSAYMEAVESEWSRPYSASSELPSAEREDWINQRLLLYYTGVRFRDVHCEVQNALLTTALALHAYRQEHGAYPPDLQALVPTYLSRIPADAFQSGAPLRYAPHRKRFGVLEDLPALQTRAPYPTYLLYSVGPDGTDEHGTPIFQAATSGATPNRANTRVLADSRGDIVAGINF